MGFGLDLDLKAHRMHFSLYKVVATEIILIDYVKVVPVFVKELGAWYEKL